MNELSESLYLIVGKQLRKLRLSKDLTLVDLEEKSKIPFKTIQRYEVGNRKINTKTLQILLSLMNKDYDEFMHEVKMEFLADEVKMHEHEFLSAKDALSFILVQPSVVEFAGYKIPTLGQCDNEGNEIENDEWNEFVNDILDYIKFKGSKLDT